MVYESNRDKGVLNSSHHKGVSFDVVVEYSWNAWSCKHNLWLHLSTKLCIFIPYIVGRLCLFSPSADHRVVFSQGSDVGWSKLA